MALPACDKKDYPSIPRRRIRRRPKLEGLSQFEGPVIHVLDYWRSEKKSFRGKKVLVVGCGNSKMDILISRNLLKHKATPIIVRPSSLLLIKVVPDIKRFNKGTVEFVNGEKLDIDAVVHATGYRNHKKELVCNDKPSKPLEGRMPINRNHSKSNDAVSKKDPKVPRRPRRRESSIKKKQLKTQTRPLESSPIVATNLTDKNQKHVSSNPWKRKSQIGEENTIRNSGDVTVIQTIVPTKHPGPTTDFILEGRMQMNCNHSKSNDAVSEKHPKVPRPRRRESSIKKKHLKDQTSPLESSPIVATDLTDKIQNHVSPNPWRRKSQNHVTVIQTIVPTKPLGPSTDFILEPITYIEQSPVILNLISSTYDGLASGQSPTLSAEGEGGAYFMRDSTGKTVSVFKPIDEEPKAVNNPRGRHPSQPNGEGLKKGTRVGQGASMELAAFVLDRLKSGGHKFVDDEMGFAGVPLTLMVKCLNKEFNHPEEVTAKIGSLQKFVENDGSCADFGPRVFPVEEVHKITVLDMRLANADRHDGNILLIRKENTVMVPIDHGYCLPTSFEDCDFVWLNWPQARQPYSLETIEYIKSLDAEEDIDLLKSHGLDLPIECARTLRISTILLKKGVERGLTPFAIGSLMCREHWNKESVVEEIVQKALGSVLPNTSEARLLDVVSEIMDLRLCEIVNSLPKIESS